MPTAPLEAPDTPRDTSHRYLDRKVRSTFAVPVEDKIAYALGYSSGFMATIVGDQARADCLGAVTFAAAVHPDGQLPGSRPLPVGQG